jgi:hypothetical protein
VTTIRDLLKAGILKEGDALIWNRRIQGKIHIAVVTNGFIQTIDGKLHKSPSGAARHLNAGKPVDGWYVWKVKNTGALLDTFRNHSKNNLGL